MSFFGDIWNGLSSAAMWAHNTIGLGAADKVTRDLIGTSMIPSALGYNGNGESYETPAQRQVREDREYQAAREDLNYERTMAASNTAYQRGAEDLKAAGLNPALVYSSGGASTPTFGTSAYSNLAGSVQQGQNLRTSALTAIALKAITKL